MKLFTATMFDGDPERLARRVVDLDAAGIDMVLVPEIYGLTESRSWLHEWARSNAREDIDAGLEYTRATPFKLAHLPQEAHDGILQHSGKDRHVVQIARAKLQGARIDHGGT